MNPFASRNTTNNWIIPVSVLSLILGFMIMTAWVTPQNRAGRLQLTTPDQRERIDSMPVNMQEEFQKNAAEVVKLREEKTTLENALADQTDSAKVLNDSLQEVKAFSGLTELEGPGIIVTLKDSKNSGGFGLDQVIHDIDVLKVVNELWAAGAEAIAVNKQRLTGRSSVRCVGPVILVDQVQVSPPVVIRAIGDADTLFGGINLPGGVLDEIRQIDEAMVSVEKSSMMRLPAFAGSTANRHAKLPAKEEEPK